MSKTNRHAPADGGTLSPRQRAFVEHYATGKMTATAAAIAAGYSPRSARAQVYDLLRHEGIKAELDKIAAQVRERTVYDAAAAFDEAGEALAYAKSTRNANAVVRAVELRARLHGLLIDRQQIELDPGPNIKQALAEARSRVAVSLPTPAALLPIRDQGQPVDAEFVEHSTACESKPADYISAVPSPAEGQ